MHEKPQDALKYAADVTYLNQARKRKYRNKPTLKPGTITAVLAKIRSSKRLLQKHVQHPHWAKKSTLNTKLFYTLLSNT